MSITGSWDFFAADPRRRADRAWRSTGLLPDCPAPPLGIGVERVAVTAVFPDVEYGCDER